mgnify:CR=1 FL=1
MDIHAPIKPNHGAGGIKLGTLVNEITEEPLYIKSLTDYDLWVYENIKLWINEGKVTEIAVYNNYQGSYDDISLGTTLQELKNRYEEIYEDSEDNISVKDLYGIIFETEPWSGDHSLNQNLDKKITEIIISHYF